MIRLFVTALLVSFVIACASPAPPAAHPTPSAPRVQATSKAHEPEPGSERFPGWVRDALLKLPMLGADHAIDIAEGEHVVVSDTHVVAGGKPVARVDQISADGRLQRVDPLFEYLKQARAEQKAKHPKLPFHGVVILWVHPATPMAVVKSVFQTCAFAGYPNGSFGVRRRSDGELARLAADAHVPRPDQVSGRLAPEVIQRTIRASYGELRKCYEAALARSPGIEGKVIVRFVIGPDGTVTSANDAGSTLADVRAVECIVDGFEKLRFPAPKGGIVTVTYPILFSPE